MIKIEMVFTPPNYILDARLCTSFGEHLLSGSLPRSDKNAKVFVDRIREIAKELKLPITVDPVVEALIEDEQAGDEDFTRSLTLISLAWRKRNGKV